MHVQFVDLHGYFPWICYFVRLDNSGTSNPINGADAPHNILNYKQGGRVGVNSYFQRHDLALTRCHWQVMHS